MCALFDAGFQGLTISRGEKRLNKITNLNSIIEDNLRSNAHLKAVIKILILKGV